MTATAARETGDAKSSRPACRRGPSHFALPDRSAKEPRLTVITKKSRRTRHGTPREYTRAAYTDVRDPKLPVSVSSERLVARRDFFAGSPLSAYTAN